GRATVRADDLSRQELHDGAAHLVERLADIRPRAVAIAGITSFRIGYRQPKAQFGRQDTSLIEGWPPEVALHVVPQPSGLTAHYYLADGARIWRGVGERIDDCPLPADPGEWLTATRGIGLEPADVAGVDLGGGRS